MRIRIGTRASKLALWQAHEVKRLLEAAHAGIEVELVEISTQGDRIVDRPLAAVGGKGLFVKEIEQALLDDVVDIAVHSSKDLPADMPPGLCLAAVLEREDPHDVLVSRHGHRLEELPPEARVGTSSLRRRAMLLAVRPDLEIVNLRGNLDTRLRKVAEGVDGLDAAVLAYAGIRRLGFDSAVTEVLPFEVMLPAAGQGVVAVQARSADRDVTQALAAIHHEPSYVALRAERALLKAIEGSCHLPVGGHAYVEDGALIVHGRVVSPDGTEVITGTDRGAFEDAEKLGVRTAEWLLGQGGDAIIAQVNAELAGTVGSGPRIDGVRVIVTRATHQSEGLAAPIRARGGEVVEVPTIRIEPTEATPVRGAFASVAEGAYDWLIFTSTNGVRFALDALQGPPSIGTTRLAVVGRATADALREYGLSADLTPQEHTSEGLLAALDAVGVGRGARCLLVGAEETRGVLQEGLRAAGAALDEVAVYRTVPDGSGAAQLREALAGPVGYVTFASPSAVTGFAQVLEDRQSLSGWRIACIGPTSATAAREAGFEVDVVPARSTATDLAAAIAEHAAKHPAAK